MKIPLQEWLSNNQPDKEMIWKRSADDQFYFMKHVIMGAFPLKDAQDFKNFVESMFVISTHTSKSIVLPVYQILWNEFNFITRNNFYDWKVSVTSPIPIFINFQKFGLFHPELKINRVYCEGFKQDWVYDCYANNTGRFTLALNNEYDFYCFLKILTHTF